MAWNECDPARLCREPEDFFEIITLFLCMVRTQCENLATQKSSLEAHFTAGFFKVLTGGAFVLPRGMPGCGHGLFQRGWLFPSRGERRGRAGHGSCLGEMGRTAGYGPRRSPHGWKDIRNQGLLSLFGTCTGTHWSLQLIPNYWWVCEQEH